MKKYRQFWADDEFVKKLEEIKAKRVLNGFKEQSLTKLTAEMIKNRKFKELEDDLIYRETETGWRFEK
jgi:hypothetical protein